MKIKKEMFKKIKYCHKKDCFSVFKAFYLNKHLFIFNFSNNLLFHLKFFYPLKYLYVWHFQ